MSAALLPRTAVAAAYLIALLVNGRVDLMTGFLAAAVVAVWIIPLLRDRRPSVSAPTRGDSALRLR